MLIRPYNDGDFGYIKRLVELFYNESIAEYGFRIDEDKLRAVIPALRDTSWLGEVNGKVIGVIAGQIVRQHIDARPIWQEYIWYVEPEHRLHGLRLLRFAEAWCRANGVDKMIMVHMHNSKADKLDRFYTHEGFRPMETHFIKTL